MSKKQNSGASSHLLTAIQQLPKTQIVSIDDALKMLITWKKDVKRPLASNTLSHLARKGFLKNGPIKGTYMLSDAQQSTTDVEVVVIDRLLDAMAAAEPVLRRWKRIQAALDAV